MIISPYEQGTQEWLNARSTVVTASMIPAVMAGATTKGRIGYMRNLANSIVTNNPAPQGYANAAMQEGTRREPESREYYALISRNTVKEVGLIYLDENKRIGASVDGLIEGDDPGNLELKNPNLDTHLGYILDGGLPSTYVKQVQGQLWVTGRSYCDFVSYHPDAFQMMHRYRVERDEDMIRSIKKATYLFIAELDMMVETFRKLQNGD